MLNDSIEIFIIIPVFNRWAYTQACLASLQKQTFKSFRTVVVDHGSTDGTSNNIAKEFPSVVTLSGDSSMWWTAATNYGIKYALENTAKFVLTLNNDLTVADDYLSNLINAAIVHEHSIIGSVSIDIANQSKVVYAGNKWNSWIAKYRPSVELELPHAELKKKYKNIETDLLPGRGTLIPKEVFETIGLFDEKHFPHYMADEDFSVRAIKAGFKCFVNTSSVVYSHYKETGLTTVHKNKKGFKYLKDSFTSIKSPNNIFVRWYWAKFYGKIPLLYFSIDFGRVFISQVIKSIK